MGFLSGFSVKAQSSLNFNPFEGIPVASMHFRNIKPMFLAHSNLMPKRIISNQSTRESEMLDNHIGHARVEIEEYRQANNSVLNDDWFGTAQVENETLPFMTDCDKLEVNKEYHVVYERTESPTGKSGIRIHDVIS